VSIRALQFRQFVSAQTKAQIPLGSTRDNTTCPVVTWRDVSCRHKT